MLSLFNRRKYMKISSITWVLITISLVLCLTLPARAIIVETNDVAEIRQDFIKFFEDYYTKDILVVVGIKNVILKNLALPTKPSIPKSDYPQILAALNKNNLFNSNNFDELLFINYKNVLTSPHLLDFFKELKTNGVKTIASSKGLTGNFNEIKKLEIWRADYLKKMNIDFSYSFIKNNYIIFNNLEPNFNTYPIFYNGILNTNNLSESELVINFIAQIYPRLELPKLLIMIHENLDVLKSLEVIVKSYSDNILVIGYHYNAPDPVELERLTTKDIIKLLNELGSKVSKVKRNNPVITNRQSKKL